MYHFITKLMKYKDTMNAIIRNKNVRAHVLTGVCWGLQLIDQCVSVTNQMFAV